MASKRFEAERKRALKRLAKSPVTPDELSEIARKHAEYLKQRKANH